MARLMLVEGVQGLTTFVQTNNIDVFGIFIIYYIQHC